MGQTGKESSKLMADNMKTYKRIRHSMIDSINQFPLY